MPTLALVGYTNAGKSTLLNKLSGSSVLSADKLFATLDPTSRKVELPHGKTIILTDTVGFIRQLPHRLVDAFRATLEEALVSEILLHVVDLSNPQFEDQMETTLSVLKELGAEEKRIVTVFNKIDLNPEITKRIRSKVLDPDSELVSSVTGEGLDGLLRKIERLLDGQNQIKKYLIPHHAYHCVAKARQEGCLRMM